MFTPENLFSKEICRVNPEKPSREECNYVMMFTCIFSVLNQRNQSGFTVMGLLWILKRENFRQNEK